MIHVVVRIQGIEDLDKIIHVIGVNLSHPRMVGLLDEAEVAYEDLVLGQMQPVT